MLHTTNLLRQTPECAAKSTLLLQIVNSINNSQEQVLGLLHEVDCSHRRNDPEKTREILPGRGRDRSETIWKTTLTQIVFSDKPYVSLEDLDTREFATHDPRGFLNRYPDGAILDEVQHCPDLFSYLQSRLDATKKMGGFVLTGSQQFGLLSGLS